MTLALGADFPWGPGLNLRRRLLLSIWGWNCFQGPRPHPAEAFCPETPMALGLA